MVQHLLINRILTHTYRDFIDLQEFIPFLNAPDEIALPSHNLA